mmetsp:Transcript_24710/g.21603  ORF Transcript_24710/g.21603 Transcript_24710/m.21603 type:complete len:145 (-) Transcript_24710:113-547(-)
MDPFDVEGTTINFLNSTHSRRTASIYSVSSTPSDPSSLNKYNNDNNKENEMDVCNENVEDEDDDIDMNMTKKPNVNGGRINVPQKHQELIEIKKKLNHINHNNGNSKKRAFNFAFNNQQNNKNGHFNYNQCGVHSGPMPKKQRY